MRSHMQNTPKAEGFLIHRVIILPVGQTPYPQNHITAPHPVTDWKTKTYTLSKVSAPDKGWGAERL